MKKVASIIILACSLFFLSRAPSAQAILLNASDEVGHVTAGGGANFTSSTPTYFNTYPGFDKPEGMVVDTVDHRLFVSDNLNYRVQVYNLDGNNNLIDKIPDYTLGGAGSVITTSSLKSPRGLAYDSVGKRLFVSDDTNYRVMVFNVATSTIANNENAMAVLGQSTFVSGSNPASATSTKFRNPQGLAYDGSSASKLLYVGDKGFNRVMVFDVTTIVNGEPAVHVLGQSDFISSASALTDHNFRSVYGIDLDIAGKRLFVADGSSNRILVFDVSSLTDGKPAANVLGQVDFSHGTSGSDLIHFNGVTGVTYDSSTRRLFASDTKNCRTLVFDASTLTDGQSAIHTLGQPSSCINWTSTVSSPDQSGTFMSEYTAIDPTSGKLYLADTGNNRVMIFDTTSITDNQLATDLIGQTFADGSSAWHKRDANNPDLSYSLGSPGYSVMDPRKHRLYVSDVDHKRVLVFNLDSNNNLVEHQADYVLGQPDLQSDDIADTDSLPNNHVIGTPAGLALDEVGQRLFVADPGYGRVLVFSVSTIVNNQTPTNEIGPANLFQYGVTFAAGLAFDSKHQRLFIADAGQNHVDAYDVNPATLFDGEEALGHLGSAYSEANSSQSGLNSPSGVAYDEENDRLFVADDGNKRVMVFDVSSVAEGQNAINVLGQSTWGSVTTGLSQSLMSGASDVAYDSQSHTLYVVDDANYRIMAYDVATISDGESAINVIGQPNFTTKTTAVVQNQAYKPLGLSFEPITSRLVVSDETANRVMIFSLPKISVTQLPPLTIGQPYSTNVSVSGGTSPYTCAVADGSLPTGLSLGSNCAITGTPTQDFGPLTIKATDNSLTSPANEGLAAYRSYASIDHFKISGAATAIAGLSHTISISAIGSDGITIDTSYTGSHTFTISGASNSPNGTHPTCSDKDGIDRVLGTSTDLEFVDGVALCDLKLYNVESATINATDGAYDTTSGSGGLPIAVSVAGPDYMTNLSTFDVTPSNSVMAGDLLTVTITLMDKAGHTYSPDFDSYGNPRQATRIEVWGNLNSRKYDSNPQYLGNGVFRFRFTAIDSGAELLYIEVDDQQLLADGDGTSDGNFYLTIGGALDHYQVTANSPSQYVGQTGTVVITAMNAAGGFYNFTDPVDKTFTFSGADAALTGEQPTCASEYGGTVGGDIPFGSPTPYHFSGSFVFCDLKLYKSGPFDINVSDGSVDSFASSSYAYRGTAYPDPLIVNYVSSSLTITPSTTGKVGQSVSIVITPLNSAGESLPDDTYGNAPMVSAVVLPDGTAENSISIPAVNNDGTYSASYTPTATGTAWIDAIVNGVNIPGYDSDLGVYPYFHLQIDAATSSSTPELPGDFDHNDKVDIFDYNTLLGNFGVSVPGNVADIDGNGRVDIFDYSIFIGNFGRAN